MPNDFPNLHAAFSKMSSGDTLIIRDGIYKGKKNCIDGQHLPPSGDKYSYTTIKAENEWKVTFDGENQRAMFYTWVPRDHVKFEGIKWINNSDASPHIYEWHFVKFIKCAFQCGQKAIRVSTVWVSASTYILFEDCHAWGDGRYSLNVQTSNHVVVRRFVSRLDAVNGTKKGSPYPVAHFMSYASQVFEWQNCIALDSNQSYFRTPASYYLGGFATHKFYSNEYTEENVYRGCIALNINMSKPHPYFAASPAPGFYLDKVKSNKYYNCIVWDVVGRGFSGSSIPGYGSKIDRCMVKILPSSSGNGDGINSGNIKVTNSIIINADRAGIRGNAESDYNLFFNNKKNHSGGCRSGKNDISGFNPLQSQGSNPPAIKYIIRIEDGSFLKDAGDAGDIGANILTRIGKDESLYGESGFNVDTGEPLWPFPNEEIIQEDMRTYKGAPAGNRGFCAEGRTLTRYIWEYLGNPLPTGIYP